ncbi:MAG: iron-sulfur cluster repair di-iron protein [Chitinophagaceae bacterium]|nr:iron-sulfur cluster repair di-iron protein [Chitinophagaceae bacterium]
MNEILTKSLAEIVTADHRAAAVFERNGLDFCCKGKRSLSTACAEKGIEPEALVGQLEESLKVPLPIADFNQYSLSDLIDHIVKTHHAYVKKELPELLGYVQKVASKHGERHPEILPVFENLFQLAEEMDLHMKKEENILFPRIKEIEKMSGENHQPAEMPGHVSIQSPIAMMELEHDQAGAFMASIRQLTNDYTPPPDACTTYRLSFAGLQAFEADLHQHVHLENNILFPKALRLFAGDSSHLKG